MDKMLKQKIIVSGNPNEGLAHSIRQRLEADFFSRSNGFDLTISSNQKRFAQLSLDYDVFINCAALNGFAQTLLLKEVYQRWKEKGHAGYIINIGSTCTDRPDLTDQIYPIEKVSLRDYSRNLSRSALGRDIQRPSSGIRVTHISPGALKTDDSLHQHIRRLDPVYVANLVVWLIQQPPEININEISLDAIQPPIAESRPQDSYV